MVIDFHTHIFPDKIAKSTIEVLENNCGSSAFFNGTFCSLLNKMDDAKIDVAINLPVLTSPKQFDSVTRFALEVNQRFEREGRIISFAGIHPRCENIPEKMKFLKDNGFKGVKIHPDYQETFIDDEGYISILKNAKDLDMIVVTHAGLDEGCKGKPIMCPPDRVLNVYKKVNCDKFVLAHFGGNRLWQEVLDKLAGKNLYFDTAYILDKIDEDLFLEVLKKHGEDKILFATDAPWQDVKSNLDVFNSFPLSQATKDKILYKNALKLLNLTEK